MPEPKHTNNGSWFIKGVTDNEMVNGLGNKNICSNKGKSQSDDVLLHRMFEKFIVECMDKTAQGEGNDEFGTGKKVDRTALIEYLEGEEVENMKTISYHELNKQANRLARILIRKLGILSCI